MCGRYRLSRRKQLIEEYFDCEFQDSDWSPRYNIAPTQDVPVVRKRGQKSDRELSLVRWGLIPPGANSSDTSGLINARAETVDTKPAFRDAIRFRRCLIPADGFYEWQKNGKIRQAFCFEVGDDVLFAFAGIWESWKDPAGKWTETCAILTTDANPVAAAVHDRMPVIVPPEKYDLWLDPQVTDLKAVAEILKPQDAGQMRAYPVSGRVNQVANDDEECSRLAKPIVIQESLF